jgi:ABC-type lipoprotein export system ATPase subunit
MTTPALAFRGVSKVYPSNGGGARFALRDVTFEVPAGRRVAVVGRSGSGKSTLLHLAAGIDLPSEGAVTVEDRELGRLSDRARTLLRRDAIGLVFQFFHLLPHLSVRDNVALPELIAGGRPAAFQPRVTSLLERVGLADRASDPVSTLSGGEMQRVAICRALLRRPRLLLADEPTGNLDDTSGRGVMELMLALAAGEGSTLVYVTHSREFAALADETWALQSGVLHRS